ncbi:hypothetical protein BGW37DRAFT_560031 [Umbelopsis sp. PMI_123]|nr:hypothetical protein BGW37DRAFT_560031 [Umbelopsis sp. PMI_123]
MVYSSNTLHYILVVAIATIVLCSITAFLRHSTSAVYIYKYTKVIKTNHESEKFIAYLPHSGLSNQRNELENALLLANYLNRTLILPPAFLGHINGWQPNDNLFQYMNALTKPQPWWNRCNDKSSLADGPCHSKGNYASAPWEFLHSSINDLDIPMRSIRHVSLDHLKSILALTDDDIYIQHDTSIYSWFLCDIPNEQCPTLDPTIFETGDRRVYDQQWNIEDLKKIEKPLIHLQGIFGIDRVGVSLSHHLELRGKIRNALIYRNTALEKVTENIVDRLGGKRNYFSIHVRMGNRQFQGALQEHVQEQIDFLENSQPGPRNSTTISSCETSDIKIYVATDAKDPRGSPELARIFTSFPCAKVLGDYIDLLSPLETEVGANIFQPPQQSIVKFLIPVIDAMVAGNAKDFMGNPSSTYSTYIKQLHSAYSQN